MSHLNSHLNKGLLSIAGAAAMLALAPQAAEAGTVVASSGPSASDFPVGTQIGDTQRITLETGDALTVLDDGGTRVLRGPGTFIPARQSGQTRNRAFAALTTQRSAARARTGAVRNTQTGQEVRNPNLWYVNIAASGTMCLNHSSTIRFWRADTVGAAVYSIAPAGEPEQAVRIEFPEREMLATWEVDGGLREGETYSIAMAPKDMASQVEFVFLDDVPDNPEDLAQTLIANGCSGQLEQLTSAMMEG
jgi:hypothetical protein